MSSVSIQPNSGGAGVFTIATPSTSTNYTLNLPAENGTLLTSGSTVNLGSKIQPIDAITNGAGSMTVTLNPTVLDFRSATTSSGAVNTRNINSAISITVLQGSTLGTIGANLSSIMVLAIDNAGTVELALTNGSGSNRLDETNLLTTIAIGASSSSNTAVYSTTARTSVPYRVVGLIQSTQTTAGYWIIPAPSGTTTVQGIGGQALASMNSLGYNQSWQTFTTGTNAALQRVYGTTYYNTTGRPIFVSLRGSGTGDAGGDFYIDGAVRSGWYASASNANGYGGGIVPNGSNYRFVQNLGGGVQSWNELR